MEGLPEHNGRPSPPCRPNWSPFWWVLLALLAINWIVSAMLLGPAPRPAVSYTFFTRQVDTGNVKEITFLGLMVWDMYPCRGAGIGVWGGRFADRSVAP